MKSQLYGSVAEGSVARKDTEPQAESNGGHGGQDDDRSGTVGSLGDFWWLGEWCLMGFSETLMGFNGI